MPLPLVSCMVRIPPQVITDLVNSSSSLCKPVDSSHIPLQHGGNRHAAIAILKVFQDGDERSSYCKSRAVQGMHQFGFTFCIAKTRLHAACLKCLTVAA